MGTAPPGLVSAWLRIARRGGGLPEFDDGCGRAVFGHDYLPKGRDQFAWETSVAEQRAANVHIGGGKSREDFVEMREARDATLGMPKLIIPSLQVNMRAGHMPEADDDGDVYLKVPVNKLGK